MLTKRFSLDAAPQKFAGGGQSRFCDYCVDEEAFKHTAPSEIVESEPRCIVRLPIDETRMEVIRVCCINPMKKKRILKMTTMARHTPVRPIERLNQQQVIAVDVDDGV